MGFFNGPTADIVQHISLPLEAVGFVLVLIEIYWRRVGERLEWEIDFMTGVDVFIAESVEPADGSRMPTAMILIVPLFILIWIALFGSLSWEEHRLWKGMTLVIGVVTAGSAFIPILARFLNRLTDGRALGSLGLVLAFLGLLGEVYQIITMYVAPG